MGIVESFGSLNVWTRGDERAPHKPLLLLYVIGQYLNNQPRLLPFCRIEAAHIKWHQAGGPDTHPNGLALCSLHHKLFDRGMITFTDDYRILVSESATGSAMFQHLVLDFHGRELNMPVRPAYNPDPQFIGWHVREVFRSPAIYLKSA